MKVKEKGKRRRRQSYHRLRSKMDNKSRTNYCCYYLSWMDSIDSPFILFQLRFESPFSLSMSIFLFLSVSLSLLLSLRQNEQVDQNRTRITLMCVRLIWPARVFSFISSSSSSLWWQREASLIQLPGESLFHFLFLCVVLSFIRPLFLLILVSLSLFYSPGDSFSFSFYFAFFILVSHCLSI